MSSVGSIGGGSSLDLTSTSDAKFQENVFLNLLVAEMKLQNPLEPVGNDSFMNQMAQFSSMEQTRQMNDSLLELLQFQGLLARFQGLDQAGNLLGKMVEWDDGQGGKGSGEVLGVEVKDGGILLDLGDRTVPLDQVVGIRAKAGQEA